MIDSYRFGQIVIDKIPYDKDVIVFPDKVQSNWWRREGHKLHLDDIRQPIKAAQPKVLVVGTGKFGIMHISQEVKDFLETRGIKLYAEPTDKATKIYNRLLLTEPRLMGAFHLTC
jgi:hypothetical protein